MSAFSMTRMKTAALAAALLSIAATSVRAQIRACEFFKACKCDAI